MCEDTGWVRIRGWEVDGFKFWWRRIICEEIVHFYVSGMTIAVFGLLIIFLDYILKLNPPIWWVGLIMLVVGMGGVLWK